MKSILSAVLVFTFFTINAQSKLFKSSNPQIIYEMFIESVEPIHLTFDDLNTTENRPSIAGGDVIKMESNSRHRLETFHKDKLHRDAYTAGLVYLDNVKPIIEELEPVLDAIETADEESIGGLMGRLHDITIKEKHHAEVYRDDIRKVIDLFAEDWSRWLEDEVIYFSRMTAQQRKELYNSGFGESGLKAVKRRFYTAEYFVVNMEQDVTETRVNSIKATFHDLSEFPDHMVQNVDDFITSVDEPLLRYGYEKVEKKNVITYTKGKETTFDFNVKQVEITIHSRNSNTLTIKFIY